MRDPLGVHTRRVRRALDGQLGQGDSVEAVARDEVNGDYWVLTGRELIVVHAGAVTARVALDQATCEVTERPVGITIQIGNRGGNPLLTTFRKPNDLTRHLSDALTPER